MRYIYEFERIEVKAPLFVWNKSRPYGNYRDVIRKRAEEGWRFIQIFAPPLTGYGHARYYDLIFEREKSPNYQQ